MHINEANHSSAAVLKEQQVKLELQQLKEESAQ